MRLKLTILSLMVLACSAANAHKHCNASLCAEKRMGNSVAAKTTVATSEENYYDIKHVKFDIELTNTSAYVQGNVTTTATVSVPSMSVYAFELNSALTIDSFKLNNVILPVTTTGSVRMVNLPTALTLNTVFSAQVFYKGAATAGNGQFFTGGLHPVNDGGFKLMYSISDDLYADDWWPCKQSLVDKIDSVDMWVTTDDTLKVGSNGLLKNTVTLPANKLRYEWKTQYPIDYYLIAVAVAPYNEYSYFMHFTDGSNDSMLIQNYIYNTPGHFTPTAKAALDSTGYIVDHFSSLFGRYPFDKEKYGHSMSKLGGGMEHQTMTTMGTVAYNVVTLIAHELGHQWWGNNVTYGSWRDIWLSEGITSYCEQLFVEKFRGGVAAKAYRTSIMNASKAPTGTVYVDDTTNVYRIFDRTLTYDKGASVTHMLRYMAPHDSLFFKGLRAYQQQYGKSVASTANLQQLMEQSYGFSLDTFFSQWIFREGFPTYSAKWAQQGSLVVIQIKQITSKPSSVQCFQMPIEIKLKTDKGDRIITLFNNVNTQTFVTACEDEISSIEIDPNDHIINNLGQIQKDAAVLGVADNIFNKISLSPNPTHDNWYINGLPEHTRCTITDVSGKTLSEQYFSGSASISAKELPAGTYILSIHKEGSLSKHIYVVKY